MEGKEDPRNANTKSEKAIKETMEAGKKPRRAK